MGYYLRHEHTCILQFSISSWQTVPNHIYSDRSHCVLVLLITEFGKVDHLEGTYCYRDMLRSNGLGLDKLHDLLGIVGGMGFLFGR